MVITILLHVCTPAARGRLGLQPDNSVSQTAALKELKQPNNPFPPAGCRRRGRQPTSPGALGRWDAGTIANPSRANQSWISGATAARDVYRAAVIGQQRCPDLQPKLEDLQKGTGARDTNVWRPRRRTTHFAIVSPVLRCEQEANQSKHSSRPNIITPQS